MCKGPLISVIVPVYNVSAYLNECIDGIINQTYRNLEIILVDDGSPDDCPQKCDYYASIDRRITVIHQPNGGLSDARNAALNICQGEYLTFIDSDDAVASDYIETLYNALSQNKVEIAVCDFMDFSSEIPADKTQSQSPSVYRADDAIKVMLKGQPFTTSAWAKLYNRRLFRELRFPKGMIYEDLATVWKAFVQVDEVVYAPAVKYYYRQNPTSITQMHFSYKNMDIVKAHEMLLDEMPGIVPDLVPSVRARFGCYAAIQLYHALRCAFPDCEALKQLQKPIKRNIRFLLGSSFPLRIKLFGFLMSNNCIFSLFCRLRRRSTAAH